MRAPLIVLISAFAVGLGGLILMPGVDPDGNPWRMDLFEAFYFMTYTAPTIGYGEIPHPFTTQQRLWVVFTIYLSVFAWAYAIGTLLSLLQDRGFRDALGLQRFERQVRRLREPFLIVAGFGQAGEVLARSLDALDRRLVVIDFAEERIDALDLASFRSDVPGLVGDARNPNELRRAGLDLPHCAGIVALTNDDEANLAITMAAALLRPDLPVVARSVSQDIERRMREFGQPTIIDPFNVFGDDLVLAFKAPQTHRLVQWLTSDPGAKEPPEMPVPREGRWVIAGYGRFGSHLARDLRRHGLAVTIIDDKAETTDGCELIHGQGIDPAILAQADLESAVGFAAATDNDTENLSMLVAASHANSDLFLVGRQNEPMNSPLFESVRTSALLVPTQLVAHEVLARIGSPALWRFIREAQHKPDDWAAPLLDRLRWAMGRRLQEIWVMNVDPVESPALVQALGDAEVTLSSLLRDPEDRSQPLEVVPLMIRRGAWQDLAPIDERPLAVGDQILLAGSAAGRRALSGIVNFPQSLQYVTTGEHLGTSWAWRKFVDR